MPPDNLAPSIEPVPQRPQLTPPPGAWVDLARYDNSEYHPGRGPVTRIVWYYVSLLAFEGGWLPLGGVKRRLLRLFGARIGRGVTIKPNVRVKYPWKLSIGDHCWIGQDVWIDSIAEVRIGSHVCLSQLVYLCTGSHDRRSETFDLVTKPIVIEDGAWIAARATVLPGVTIGANAVVASGSVVTRDVRSATIVAGNPAREIAQREPPTR